MAFVVFGAGGATGRECVQRLLDLGTATKVRAVIRNPDAHPFPSHPALEVVKGDVTDPASCSAACAGADGVVFTASGSGYWSAHGVDNMGVANVAKAAKEAGVKRMVLVSSMLVTPRNAWMPLRLVLNNMRFGLMDNKHLGEEALRASGVSYTIVRPGGLTKGPGGVSCLLVGQGDKAIPGGRSISRADVAEVCIEALTNPGADRVTLEVVSKPVAEGEAPAPPLAEQLTALWSGLQPDAAPAETPAPATT